MMVAARVPAAAVVDEGEPKNRLLPIALLMDGACGLHLVEGIMGQQNQFFFTVMQNYAKLNNVTG